MGHLLGYDEGMLTKKMNKKEKEHLVKDVEAMLASAKGVAWEFSRPPVDDDPMNGWRVLKPGPKIYIRIELDA